MRHARHNRRAAAKALYSSPMANPLKRNGIGRPSKFTPETTDELLRRLSTGRLLVEVCDDHDMPDVSAVHRWAATDEAFASRLSRARSAALEMKGEKIMREAALEDDPKAANLHRIRIDAFARMAPLLAPARFAQQRIDVTTQGKALSPALDDMNLVTAASRLLHMLDQARRASTIDGQAIPSTPPLPPPPPTERDPLPSRPPHPHPGGTGAVAAGGGRSSHPPFRSTGGS